MNIITEHNETTLTIFKVLRELNKWHPDPAKVEQFNVDNVRGLTPTWRPGKDGLTILMDTDHRTYASIKWKPKGSELFITDLTFRISEAVIDQNEMLEHLLIGVVRLYSTFKEKYECIANQT